MQKVTTTNKTQRYYTKKPKTEKPKPKTRNNEDPSYYPKKQNKKHKQIQVIISYNFVVVLALMAKPYSLNLLCF